MKSRFHSSYRQASSKLIETDFRMLSSRRASCLRQCYYGSQELRCLNARSFRTYQQRSYAEYSHRHHDSRVSVLPSMVDTTSSEFKENEQQMNDVLAQLDKLHRRIEAGGSSKARQKHILKGKMLPREYLRPL